MVDLVHTICLKCNGLSAIMRISYFPHTPNGFRSSWTTSVANFQANGEPSAKVGLLLSSCLDLVVCFAFFVFLDHCQWFLVSEPSVREITPTGCCKYVCGARDWCEIISFRCFVILSSFSFPFCITNTDYCHLLVWRAISSNAGTEFTCVQAQLFGLNARCKMTTQLDFIPACSFMLALVCPQLKTRLLALPIYLY